MWFIYGKKFLCISKVLWSYPFYFGYTSSSVSTIRNLALLPGLLVILLFSAFCMLAMDSPSMSPVKKRACLVESIYQHSRINTIAPSDQFHGIRISAELMR
ncbi:uncharacterized protein [Acropora muricata]|uniref:uncharacterized protein isoform X1 n=1 Tax=Acropora muricata TaxID=159855 RepID=UPI0034E50C81